MKPYICNDPIDHDGDRFAVGDPIELSDKQAAPLLAIGAITLDAQALLVEQGDAKPARVAKKPKDKAPNAHGQADTSGDSGNQQGNQE
jgi:hypothetical protein